MGFVLRFSSSRSRSRSRSPLTRTSSKLGGHQERKSSCHAHALVLVLRTNAPSFCLGYNLEYVSVMSDRAASCGKSKEDYPMARRLARRKKFCWELLSQITGLQNHQLPMAIRHPVSYTSRGSSYTLLPKTPACMLDATAAANRGLAGLRVCLPLPTLPPSPQCLAAAYTHHCWGGVGICLGI